MTHPTRSAWDNSRHWPVAYRSQHDAGLPEGPLHDEPVTNRHRFYFGLLMGVLVFGPGLVDLWLSF